MTLPENRDIADRLNNRLSGATRIAVVGVGDETSPTDCLGMLAARDIEIKKIPGIKVFFGGTVPESTTAPIRQYHPHHILILDAAEMNARPGTLDIIGPGEISAGLLSTHAIPLTVLMEYLEKDTGAVVTLLGIQPITDSDEADASREWEYFRESVAGLIAVLSGRMRKGDSNVPSHE
ncbi:MAG: hydrogenase 3 maturation protease [Methanoregula sp. PtaU1.Bin051]|nr:MAG: hydrogenase 3 maturation protease [Methanoregula sp. PtaU1.Bin051]